MEYGNRYLLRATSGFFSIDSHGTAQALSEYILPFDHGVSVCSTFSAEANLYFLADEKGSLLARDIRNGSIKRANLAFNTMLPEPIDVYSCILHWNSADSALYVANQSSHLWRWKTNETSTTQVLSKKSLELVSLNSIPSGKIVLIGSDMTYDKVLIFDPYTDLVSKIGLGIDIRGGWIDDTTKVSYIVGFDGEVVALNPDLEDLNRIYWKIDTGINLHGALVASGERMLVLETFNGEIFSLDLNIMNLLKKSCSWLRDANAGVIFETSCK